MEALLDRWSRSVADAHAGLRRLPDSKVRVRPAPGKWSVKEIIGHLIDSATNNHRRFVLAQLEEGLTFPGYAQDEWVSRQRYQDSAWPALATLWSDYNEHLIHVVRAIPGAVLTRPRANHTLDQIAWRPVPRDQPATLAYLIDDYVEHLDHHLGQVRHLMALSD
ncbi:MAG TPA: DinB family protein [Gemmatimonadales bacterium]|nr:DinB family protein [Gemmatimonadales bacterium]